MRKSILLLAGILAIGLSSFAKATLPEVKPVPFSKTQLKEQVLAGLSADKLKAAVTVNFHEGKPTQLPANAKVSQITASTYNVQPCYDVWIFEYDIYDENGELVAIILDIYVIEYECPE